RPALNPDARGPRPSRPRRRRQGRTAVRLMFGASALCALAAVALHQYPALSARLTDRVQEQARSLFSEAGSLVGTEQEQHGQHHPDEQQREPEQPAQPHQPLQSDLPQSPSPPESPLVPDPGAAPHRIRIPAIGVGADVLPLALDAQGGLEVPEFKDAMKVGWFALGPRPGSAGPAVLVGHRDAPALAPKRGYRDAVFARLPRLKPGDKVETERRDGQRLKFTVTAVDTYSTKAFPTKKVYGPVPFPELRLITCGGALDKRGHWDSNVVVSATQDAPAQAASPAPAEPARTAGPPSSEPAQAARPLPSEAPESAPASAEGSVRAPGIPTAP
ncbi:sortase, partial [Streptomyces sp. T-3]|nr:sortase [Streptomyces sp. T-3]